MTIMTRRAALRGIAATAAASTALTVPTLASPSTEPEAVLAAWRAWRILVAERRQLEHEIVEIERTMPPQILRPTVFLFHSKLAKVDVFGASLADIERAWPVKIDVGPDDLPKWQAERARKREAKFADLQEARQAAAAERERLGHSSRERRVEEIDDQEYDIMGQIDAAIDGSPVVIAAKLGAMAALSSRDADFEAWPWAFIVNAVESLRPTLPADMADDLTEMLEAKIDRA